MMRSRKPDMRRGDRAPAAARLSARLASGLILAGACVGLLGAPAMGQAEAEASAGTLTVVVTGLEGSEGKVVFQLVRSKEDFGRKAGDDSLAGEARVENGRAQHVFEDVARGEYAVKVFHDENDNDELDTNFIGLPKERFGFSNNRMGRFGPPSYEDCKRTFAGPHERIEVEARGL